MYKTARITSVIVMKEKWKEAIFVLALGLVVPSLALSFVKTDRTQCPDIPEMTEETIPPETEPKEMKLSVEMDDGSICELELETYVTAVVLREMPADFEPEALKAQAVVARTYVLRRCFSDSKHENAVVCTDPSCCQGFYSEEDFMAAGNSTDLLEKVKQAVTETAGYVLTYEGELAEATYFSCSGGMTEDAKAVWGQDIPYLRATESLGEEGATHFTDTVTFTAEEFAERLGGGFSGFPGTWIGKITYTDGGGVDTIVLGDSTYSGTELRKLLGLRSTAFVITIVGDRVTVTTKGFGHRVGMSQYGADAMALKGSTYDQILAHYYQGTALELFDLGD